MRIATLLALSATLLLSLSGFQAPPPEYERAWQQIDSLLQKGHLRSAYAQVQALERHAWSEKNLPHWVKAIKYRAELETQLHDDEGRTALTTYYAALQSAPPTARAILQTMLATQLADYLSAHAWTLSQRTHNPLVDSLTPATWTLPFVLHQIDELLSAALHAPDLGKARVADWQAICTGARETSPLRPTLLDLVAARCTRLWLALENYVPHPPEPFELEAEALFEDAPRFVRIELPPAPQPTPLHRATQAYQIWLRHRLADDNFAALLDADLQRLHFMYRHASTPDKGSRYLAALTRWEKRCLDRRPAAEVWAAQAQYYFEQGNPQYAPQPDPWREAVRICRKALKTFPDSWGAAQCRDILQQIEAPRLQASMDDVLIPDTPALLRLQWRNVRSVRMRLIRLDEKRSKRWQAFQAGPRESRSRSIEWLEQLPAVHTAEWTLPGFADWRRHTSELPLPALPSGKYLILLQAQHAHDEQQAFFARAFQVSAIAWVSWNHLYAPDALFVLHREQGHPLFDARLEVWARTWQQRAWSTPQHVITLNPDKYGEIGLPDLPRHKRKYLLRFIWRADTLQIEAGRLLQEVAAPPDEEPDRQALILLDRPIYRPGQVVHYKVIYLERDPAGRPHLLPHQRIAISLRDAFGNEVATQQRTTNAFGSAAGKFALPEARPTGSWTLSVQPSHSSLSFPVEAYKRPRFEARLKPPSHAIRLGDTVRIEGLARAYGGYPVIGAKVEWTVERQAEWAAIPWRERVRLPEPMLERVARGQTQSDAEGRFAFSFPATTPASHAHPHIAYRYFVTATVTDGTGETHAATLSLTIGPRALYIETHAPRQVLATSWDSLYIALRNQANQPIEAGVQLQLHRLLPPATPFLPRPWPAPDRPLLDSAAFRQMFPLWPWQREQDPSTWPIAETIWQREASGSDLHLPVHPPRRHLPAGVYRLEVTSTDPFGQAVHDTTHIWVLAPDSRSPLPAPLVGLVPQQTVAPGSTATIHLATPFDDRPALAILERGDKLLSKGWFTIDRWALRSRQITADERGGLNWTVLTLLHNRFYLVRQHVAVPWTDKRLHIRFGQFRDKLQPGEASEWILRIESADGQPVAAEMAATLYDASLEAFASQQWPSELWPSFHGHSLLYWGQTNSPQGIFPIRSFRHSTSSAGRRKEYPALMRLELFPHLRMRTYYDEASPAPEALEDAVYPNPQSKAPAPPPARPHPDQAKPMPAPVPRTQLGELVFFEPLLTTDAQGRIALRFKMNEAITRWKLRLFAHTKGLATTYAEREVVTSKELLILPHAPRFVREGDRIGFTAKVVNHTAQTRHFHAILKLANGRTGMLVYKWQDNPQFHIDGKVPAHGSKDIQWWFEAPPADEVPLLEYTVEVSSGDVLDAERGLLPVLPDRMLVTETQALTIAPNQNREVVIEKLREPGSSTHRPYALTLEFAPNPIWLAVKALPYLAEYPHACSEQIFSRLYAHALAAAIVRRHPRIRTIFEAWRRADGDALLSPLERNEALKSILLAETPWVLDALTETEQRHRLALLFDLQQMAARRQRALQQLADSQNADGGWPWFQGGPSNPYITQYIVEGFGHLRQLEAWDPTAETKTAAMLEQAMRFLDNHLLETYDELARRVQEGKDQWETDHLSPTIIHYLYARSFFAEWWPQHPQLERAHSYYRAQAAEFWHHYDEYLQGMLALALYRSHDTSAARAILQSLRERALHHPEQGMYWKLPTGWYWYQHPIETQALLLEAFAEIDPQPDELDAMRAWLLCQKQTQAWPTTKATAEAIYALLATGTDWLEPAQPLHIALGKPDAPQYPFWNQQLAAARDTAEAGTGYFKLRLESEWLEPDLGQLRVTNPNPHSAWGAVYYQYFERLDRIAAQHGSPLQVERQFFRKKTTPAGVELEPLTPRKALQPGDEVIVRILIHTDRDMEFVHLKDMRASGLEPVEVRSGYHYAGRLGYYLSTRDEATHFFFDRLPKGTHVLEYRLRAIHRGTFQTGIASVQCMYAPQFAAHSQGDVLAVK